MTSSTRRIGLVSKSNAVPFSELAPVCEAINEQLREVGAAWGVHASVEPRQTRSESGLNYVTISDLPPGFEPPQASGLGDDALRGQHFKLADVVLAQVRYTSAWSVTASHECIEMAVNPDMDLLRLRPPLSAFSALPEGTDEAEVEYLVEVCDPCQFGSYAYAAPGTDPPIMVSDFLLPEYFELGSKASRFSFHGSITEPFQVLPHGCVSWGVRRTHTLWQQWVDERGVRVVAVDDRWDPQPHPDASQSRRQALYGSEKDAIRVKQLRIPDANTIAHILGSLVQGASASIEGSIAPLNGSNPRHS